MFYPLGRNSEKPYGGGGGGAIHTPLYVRGLKNLVILFENHFTTNIDLYYYISLFIFY